jgi:hypothetical protein
MIVQTSFWVRPQEALLLQGPTDLILLVSLQHNPEAPFKVHDLTASSSSWCEPSEKT